MLVELSDARTGAEAEAEGRRVEFVQETVKDRSSPTSTIGINEGLLIGALIITTKKRSSRVRLSVRFAGGQEE